MSQLLQLFNALPFSCVSVLSTFFSFLFSFFSTHLSFSKTVHPFGYLEKKKCLFFFGNLFFLNFLSIFSCTRARLVLLVWSVLSRWRNCCRVCVSHSRLALKHRRAHQQRRLLSPHPAPENQTAIRSPWICTACFASLYLFLQRGVPRMGGRKKKKLQCQTFLAPAFPPVATLRRGPGDLRLTPMIDPRAGISACAPWSAPVYWNAVRRKIRNLFIPAPFEIR